MRIDILNIRCNNSWKFLGICQRILISQDANSNIEDLETLFDMGNVMSYDNHSKKARRVLESEGENPVNLNIKQRRRTVLYYTGADDVVAKNSPAFIRPRKINISGAAPNSYFIQIFIIFLYLTKHLKEQKAVLK
uniref:Uncharacterized protein n=1 Tax=Glossina palpalis gambiensis TaxID=67801 RepID=A0A1B0BZJ0_9MUSC